MRDYVQILQENDKRKGKLFYKYDPFLGIGSPIPRFKLNIDEDRYFYAPESFKTEPIINYATRFNSLKEFYIETHDCFNSKDFENGIEDIFRLRCKHDFEFWAATCVKIKRKRDNNDDGGESLVPYILNYGQLIIEKEFERQRREKIPIRMITVKDRQWGSSTYFVIKSSWLQLYHYTNWNAAICAAFDDQAKNIRGKLTLLAKEYPKDFEKIILKPYEGSIKNKLIVQRNCVLGVGSMQNPDYLRSLDFDGLICSEVAYWKETKEHKPDEMLLGLRAGISNSPNTVIILESTGKGAGGLFHSEYKAAKKGMCGYAPIFVPWYVHKNHIEPIDNYELFIDNMTEYDWFMWGEGATLEGIKWYNSTKRRENYSDKMMKSENPTTDIEAFQFGTDLVFEGADIAKMRQFTKKPIAKGHLTAKGLVGKEAIENIEFVRDNYNGKLLIWSFPDHETKVAYRYSTVMDIGGRREKADKTVITVMDRYFMMEGGLPEKVCRWSGNVDLDRAAIIAIQIAEWYNHSLFTPEMNYLSSKENRNTDGPGFLTVIDEVAKIYNNIFMRATLDKLRKISVDHLGFSMTNPMKTRIINGLIQAFRDSSYLECDDQTLDEAMNFEYKEDGTMGAIEGEHDDNLISTGINHWVSTSFMKLPYLKTEEDNYKGQKIVGDGMANF